MSFQKTIRGIAMEILQTNNEVQLEGVVLGPLSESQPLPGSLAGFVVCYLFVFHSKYLQNTKYHFTTDAP